MSIARNRAEVCPGAPVTNIADARRERAYAELGEVGAQILGELLRNDRRAAPDEEVVYALLALLETALLRRSPQWAARRRRTRRRARH